MPAAPDQSGAKEPNLELPEFNLGFGRKRKKKSDPADSPTGAADEQSPEALDEGGRALAAHTEPTAEPAAAQAEAGPGDDVTDSAVGDVGAAGEPGADPKESTGQPVDAAGAATAPAPESSAGQRTAEAPESDPESDGELKSDPESGREPAPEPKVETAPAPTTGAATAPTTGAPRRGAPARPAMSAAAAAAAARSGQTPPRSAPRLPGARMPGARVPDSAASASEAATPQPSTSSAEAAADAPEVAAPTATETVPETTAAPPETDTGAAEAAVPMTAEPVAGPEAPSGGIAAADAPFSPTAGTRRPSTARPGAARFRSTAGQPETAPEANDTTGADLANERPDPLTDPLEDPTPPPPAATDLIGDAAPSIAGDQRSDDTDNDDTALLLGPDGPPTADEAQAPAAALDTDAPEVADTATLSVSASTVGDVEDTATAWEQSDDADTEIATTAWEQSDAADTEESWEHDQQAWPERDRAGDRDDDEAVAQDQQVWDDADWDDNDWDDADWNEDSPWSDDPDEETTGREKRRLRVRRSRSRKLSAPAVPPHFAAMIAGIVAGLVTVVIGFGASSGCAAIRGSDGCGGGLGLLALVVILAIEVFIGAKLLQLWRITDPYSTSFLGVGLVAMVAMLVFLDSIDSPWMFLVIPVLTALAFLLSWWVTVRFVEEPERRR